MAQATPSCRFAAIHLAPPCAKVLPAAKMLVRRKSPAAFDGIVLRHGRGGVPRCCLGKLDAFPVAAEARGDGHAEAERRDTF